ncbi:MAG TPA: VOC family protein [Gemmatimonadales bacterium]|nr:VOC family protein [Gemmatimonadales bacterium]
MLENVTPTPMLAVKEVSRARRFYEDTLGLEPLPTEVPGVIRYRAGGGIFVVYESRYAGTNQATALNWSVGDELEKRVGELRKKGVTFEQYDLPGTRREGDIHVSGKIRNAWFKDPDGNIHALSNV